MASMRQAINEKCKDCTYDSAEPGTWREQVGNCTIRSCSLWPLRPRSKSRNAVESAGFSGTAEESVA